MNGYYNNRQQFASAFYNGQFIFKGYVDCNIIHDSDFVVFTVNPTPADAIVTFFDYGFGQVDGHSITVKKGTSLRYTVNKDNYFMYTSSTTTVNYTRSVSVTLSEQYTCTINPTPSDATVVLDAGDPQYVQVGNSIKVPYGTLVNYTVSKTGYVTSTGFVAVTNNDPTSIILNLQTYTLTINPTPSDSTVILTAPGYTQSGNSIVVPSGTSVDISVTRASLSSYNETKVINSDETKNIELTYPTGTVLFESSTPGNYTFNPLVSVNCSIMLKGAGGGGGSAYATGVYYDVSTYNTTQNYNDIIYSRFDGSKTGINGTAGELITGSTIFNSNTVINITVGEGGTGGWTSHRDSTARQKDATTLVNTEITPMSSERAGGAPDGINGTDDSVKYYDRTNYSKTTSLAVAASGGGSGGSSFVTTDNYSLQAKGGNGGDASSSITYNGVTKSTSATGGKTNPSNYNGSSGGNSATSPTQYGNNVADNGTNGYVKIIVITS